MQETPSSNVSAYSRIQNFRYWRCKAKEKGFERYYWSQNVQTSKLVQEICIATLHESFVGRKCRFPVFNLSCLWLKQSWVRRLIFFWIAMQYLDYFTHTHIDISFLSVFTNMRFTMNFTKRCTEERRKASLLLVYEFV